MAIIRKIFVCGIMLLTLLMFTGAGNPGNIYLEKASYRKVTISWLPSEALSGISHYAIYRDGQEIATSTTSSYTDDTAVPGTEYTYKVFAVLANGNNIELPGDLAVQTLKSAAIEHGDLVEDIVDCFHEDIPSNLNAVSLLSAVKSGFEALMGSNILFSVVDDSIVTCAMAEELALINEVTPELTGAERMFLQNELNAIMESSFSGNSFDHAFINQQLTSLGDRHWNAGNKLAAELFYEFSLNYLSNHEPTVFHTLSRLAFFSKSHLSADSSQADIAESLNTAKTYLDYFFDLFPESDSTSNFANQILIQPARWYFTYFPKMLPYSNYDASFFATALETAERLTAFSENNVIAAQRLEQIAAWELVTLQLRITDENGAPRSGSLIIRNVSAENGREYLFPEKPVTDEREFTLNNGMVTLPVYIGHDYTLSLNVDIDGDTRLKCNFPVFRYGKNKLITYDYLNDSFTEEPSAQSQVHFVFSSAAYPYNMYAERGIDVFDLTWDWTAPENFTTAGFKVFRGDTEVATVAEQTVRLPLNNPEGEYRYRVAAFDINGNLSAFSQFIVVAPEEQSQYLDFFEWLESFFGESETFASDDPDGDGLDNFHEFLNGSDPTKAFGPTLYAGARGFTELTIAWDGKANNADATYQISRNGVVVAIVNTTEFTDVNLVPGVAYSYRVRQLLPLAEASDWSLPNTFRTQQAHKYEHADKVQQVVDNFLRLNILEYTVSSLVSAVRSALEALTGTNMAFTAINADLVEQMVKQELDLLREFSPPMSAAENIVARKELNEILNEWAGGNSFEDMYIHAKLVELAENHWQKYMADPTVASNKTAAVELLEASLYFMADNELYVTNVLGRLAMFEILCLNADSTNEQIKNALLFARNAHLRIYNYLPEAVADFSNPYRVIIAKYKKFFPRLLAYETYDQSIIEDVLLLAAAYREQDIASATRRDLYDEIAGWRLSNLTVTTALSQGSITLENVTPNFPVLPWITTNGSKDIRTFQLNGTPLTIPVYSGHRYKVTLQAPVEGGVDWVHSVAEIKFGSGLKITDNPFDSITIEEIDDADGHSEFVMPVGRVDFPYNLEYEKYPDSFTLKWQYVPLNDTKVDHYNIYRGNILVATSQGTICSGLAIDTFADGVYTYSVAAVDAGGVESAKSPIVHVLPDFTDEEKKYFEWKQKYFGNASVLATDDNDGDGLTNYQEYLLGSNPSVSATSVDLGDLTAKIPGVRINYYNAPHSSMPDFAGQSPFKSEVRSEFCFNSASGNVLGSGRAEQVAFTADGFFEIETDGYYSFIAKSNDGIAMFINGVKILSHSLIDSPREVAATIYLKAGINSFQVQYFNYSNAAELQLKWGAKGGEMKNFSSERLWHLENPPAELLEYIAARKDSDGDRISDMDEVRIGTSQFDADSDSDGISDYAELKIHCTDPNNKDTNNNDIPDGEEIKLDGINLDNVCFELCYEGNGADYVAAVGTWEKSGNRAHCMERRGALTYNIPVAGAGIYKLEILLSSAYATGNDNSFDLYIDGKYVGGTILPLDTSVQSFTVMTPYLQQGIHDATIHWDNHRLTEDLLINKLKLYCIKDNEHLLNGADAQTQPSVAEKIVAQRNQLETAVVSRVSPFCLTGISEFPALTQVNAETAIVFAENKWMKNVTLDENSPVNAYVSFENGAVAKTASITWHTTDVAAEDGKTLFIRKGDSLLLTVNDANAAIWAVTGEEINLTGENGQKQACRFDTPGKYVLMGTCYDSSGTNIKNHIRPIFF